METENKVYVVYSVTFPYSFDIHKVFDNVDTAETYCENQNSMMYQEFDDWGLCKGTEYRYQEFDLEE